LLVLRPYVAPLSDSRLQLLDAFAAQVALALERAYSSDAARAAQVASERASLRNTLLASISHDLLTPLAADEAIQSVLRILFEATAARGEVAAKLHKPDIVVAAFDRGALPMGGLQIGAVSIDMSRRVVQNPEGREVRLTPIEHRIRESLVRHGDRIVTHAALIREVWGPNRDDSRALRVYIGSLRRKLEADPGRPKHILTELGIGYRLVFPTSCEQTQALH
jgi:K+-sensing histidine kinase KdpD